MINEDTVVENMTKVMKDSIRKTLHRSYTVKVNDTSVNLGSYGEVHELLEQALAPYDTANQYQVALELDADREVNVLEAVVLSHIRCFQRRRRTRNGGRNRGGF